MSELDHRPARIRFEPMTAAEFEASVRAGIARRAEEQAEHGIWSHADAAEASRAEFAQLLPQGRDTPHYRFCTVIDTALGERVGECWYSVEAKGGKVQFWLHWVWIDPQHRRRGLARSVLLMLEKEALARGADRLGLYVAADNVGAFALYSQLGYRVTNMRMAKRVAANP